MSQIVQKCLSGSGFFSRLLGSALGCKAELWTIGRDSMEAKVQGVLERTGLGRREFSKEARAQLKDLHQSFPTKRGETRHLRLEDKSGEKIHLYLRQRGSEKLIYVRGAQLGRGAVGDAFKAARFRADARAEECQLVAMKRGKQKDEGHSIISGETPTCADNVMHEASVVDRIHDLTLRGVVGIQSRFRHSFTDRKGDAYHVGELYEGDARSRAKPQYKAQNLAGVTQLLQGLATLHERGIAHNDLALRNIFTSGDRYVIADFGLASKLDEGGAWNDVRSLGRSIIELLAPEISHADYMVATEKQRKAKSALENQGIAPSQAAVLLEMAYAKRPGSGLTARQALERWSVAADQSLKQAGG